MSLSSVDERCTLPREKGRRSQKAERRVVPEALVRISAMVTLDLKMRVCWRVRMCLIALLLRLLDEDEASDSAQAGMEESVALPMSACV
jgi:hypothetical protein